jgi:hypothetical protein
MLKAILSISGKPGLYKLVSQGKNILIVESLAGKRRIPVYVKDKIIALSDISIYTSAGEIPLHRALAGVKAKENGGKVSIDIATAKPGDLRAYLAEIFPDFDRERVYPSEIKKLLMWYDCLIDAGITDFTPQEPEENKPEGAEVPKEKE